MHYCPSCGSACDCGGDIEDRDTGEELTEICICECSDDDIIFFDEEDFADVSEYNNDANLDNNPIIEAHYGTANVS